MTTRRNLHYENCYVGMNRFSQFEFVASFDWKQDVALKMLFSKSERSRR